MDREGVGVTTADRVGVGERPLLERDGVMAIDAETDTDAPKDGVILMVGTGDAEIPAPAVTDAETAEMLACAGTTIVPTTGAVQLAGSTVTPIAAAATA